MGSFGSDAKIKPGNSALSVLVLAICLSAQSPLPLFKMTPAPTAARSEANPFATRVGYVTVDWHALAGAHTPSEVTQLLNLNLFEDVSFLVERRKLTWLGPNRFNWIGQIGDDDVILAVRNGHMVGTVQKGPQVFEIRSVDGITHEITETNQEKFSEIDRASPNDLVPEAGQEHKIEEKQPPGPVPSGPLTTIDVMVFYNQSVASKNPNMEAYLGSLIALSNRIYERSLIPQEIRLVHSGLATKCNTSNANSCMNTDPEVVAKRTQYGADITGYIHDGSASYCGVSNGSCCMTAIYSCALSNKSFTHEFGHNMGAGHDAAQTSSSGYAHGWIDSGKKWRTVMAYPCSGGNCPRIDNFSNPTVMQDSRPTGEAETADNARRVRERMASVAARQATKVTVDIGERVIIDPPAGYSIRGLAKGAMDLHVNRGQKLTIAFFSLGGKKTAVANRAFPAGDHKITWRPESLSRGVNILIISGKSGRKAIKLMGV
jgi:peptidyl-Asp metalloendopeptidase